MDDITDRITALQTTFTPQKVVLTLLAFKTALTRLFWIFTARKIIFERGGWGVYWDDVLEGLTAVVSVKLHWIQLKRTDQSKARLHRGSGCHRNSLWRCFANFLEENPDDAKAIINKSILILRARKLQKPQRISILRKGALEGNDFAREACRLSKQERRRVWAILVERDSAGGTAKWDEIGALRRYCLCVEDLERERARQTECLVHKK